MSHFKSYSGEIWHDGAVLGHPPQAKYSKNRLWGTPLLGKFIPKNTNFGDLGGCTPTFFNPQ